MYEPPTFQRRVVAWLMECFSMEVCLDRTERNHRFLEEALELVQSLGCIDDATREYRRVVEAELALEEVK